ncbi:MAG: sensor histidine kinase [Flavobacteriia bacterium]|nr:sensor histidine kinase [Flavobacteriia bacterium]
MLILILIFLALLLILSAVFYYMIKSKNNRLLKLIKENDFLVGEANHRIKNNLQLILSLLADESSKNKENKIENDSIKNITSKIEAITSLHQQLYRIKDKSQVNLSDYINSIYLNLAPIFKEKGIHVTTEIKKISFDSNRSVYVGLLVNELLTNGFKHAFSENEIKKSITLKINEENGTIIIYYQDNGKGLEDENKPYLVELLCKQLKSRSEFINNNGLIFKLYLKK